MDVLTAYKDRQEQEYKKQVAMIYDQAELTAMFVNLGLNGKRIPPIYEIYPTLFKREECVDYNLLIRQMESFCMNHNNQQKGDSNG